VRRLQSGEIVFADTTTAVLRRSRAKDFADHLKSKIIKRQASVGNLDRASKFIRESRPTSDIVETVTIIAIAQVEQVYTPPLAASVIGAALDGLGRSIDAANHCPGSNPCAKTTCTTIGTNTTCTTTTLAPNTPTVKPYTGLATELTFQKDSGAQMRVLILNDRTPAKFSVGRQYGIVRDKNESFVIGDDGTKWAIHPIS
jgi:hypothetical protein